MKFMFLSSPIFKDKNSTEEKNHGNFIETNRAMFFLEKEGGSKLNKIYYSDFNEDYTLLEFAEQGKAKTDIGSFFQELFEKYGVIYTDFNNGNIKNGKIVDYGGIEVQRTSQYIYFGSLFRKKKSTSLRGGAVRVK